MKRVLWISGLCTILLFALYLTGWPDRFETMQQALRQGNSHFVKAAYEEALALYEAGLAADSEDETLNFNAAQAAYLIGAYDKAVAFYEKSDDSKEKFINLGNVCFTMGNAVEEPKEKAQYYSQALQTYREGIVKYPQDVPLKYNYEVVLEMLEEIQQDEKQESEESGESGESGEESSAEQEQADEASGENGEQNQAEPDQGEAQSAAENGEQEEQDGAEEEQQDAYSAEESESESDTEADQEAVEYILQMLENQEEESLKNNREIVGGNEGKNGW